MAIAEQKELPCFAEYFSHLDQRDDFGYHPDWNEEVEKCLQEFRSFDDRAYQTCKGRVLQEPIKRDEFLNELRAMRMCRVSLGLEILAYEPPGVVDDEGHLHLLDFSFRDTGGRTWYADVKSNSWQRAVFEDDRLTLDEKRERKKGPQYLNGEARSIGIEDRIASAAQKASKQFRPGELNLLWVFAEDSAHAWMMTMAPHRVADAIRRNDPAGLISAAVIANAYLNIGPNEEVQYVCSVVRVLDEPVLPRV